MKKKMSMVVGALVIAAVAVAAAAGGLHSKSHKQATVTIAFLPKAVGIPYFDVAASGGRQAGKELGGKFKQVGPTETTAPAQISWINTLTQQRVSAIAISANDPNALVPALKRAMSRGVKVVSYDSDVAPAGRSVFVNQTRAKDFGVAILNSLAKQMRFKGDFAILSTTTTATNQNTWIKFMKQELRKPKYKGMKLLKIAYGLDQDQPSYQQAQGLLTAYPKLKGIIGLSSVALPAAARVLEAQRKAKKIVLTGGSTPNQMRKYVKDGTVKEFVLWNVKDLGYLTYYAAYDLIAGKIKGKTGETFKAGHLGTRTIRKNGEIVLGPPYVFNRSNIDKFNF